MTEKDPLEHFLPVLENLSEWFRRTGARWAIVGGVAASLVGRPRATVDVDALGFLPEEDLESVLAQGGQLGFTPRISDCLAFAAKSRVLLLTHHPSGVDVDVSLAGLPFENELVERAIRLDVGGLEVPVATPEDLVVMKAIARRPQDISDIESILDAHPDLDRRRVVHWVRAFADVLDSPDFVEDLERILDRHPPE